MCVCVRVRVRLCASRTSFSLPSSVSYLLQVTTSCSAPELKRGRKQQQQTTHLTPEWIIHRLLVCDCATCAVHVWLLIPIYLFIIERLTSTQRMREAAILVDFFWLSVCYTITTRDSQDPKTHNKNNTPPKKKKRVLLICRMFPSGPIKKKKNVSSQTLFSSSALCSFFFFPPSRYTHIRTHTHTHTVTSAKKLPSSVQRSPLFPSESQGVSYHLHPSRLPLVPCCRLDFVEILQCNNSRPCPQQGFHQPHLRPSVSLLHL